MHIGNQRPQVYFKNTFINPTILIRLPHHQPILHDLERRTPIKLKENHLDSKWDKKFKKMEEKMANQLKKRCSRCSQNDIKAICDQLLASPFST